MSRTSASVTALERASLRLALSEGRSEQEFNIEAQPMDNALSEWAEQTGYQVLLPSDACASGHPAPDIAGTYTPARALDQLLAGSSFQYEFANARTVAIRTSAGSAEVAGPDDALRVEQLLNQTAPIQTAEDAALLVRKPGNADRAAGAPPPPPPTPPSGKPDPDDEGGGKKLWRMLIETVVALAMFAIVAVAGVAVECVVRYLAARGISDVLLWGLRAGEYSLFVGDLIMLLRFIWKRVSGGGRR